MKISICIPTYNRAGHLTNCLKSIKDNRLSSNVDFEICVSDNASIDNTEEVVRDAQKHMPIKYRRNAINLGIPQNFLNVVGMAEGEFAWLLGDDDLLMPDAIERLSKLIDQNKDTDFFYVNSYHLTSEYVLSHPQPFNTQNLPADMKPFSTYKKDEKLKFLD